MAIKNKTIQIILSLLLLLELCFGYAQPTLAATTAGGYSGVESSISTYLCTPSQNGNGGGQDIYNCINKLYRFAIVVAGIVGMFMIMIAGYMYMSAGGNGEAVTKAKGWITSSIAAMVILLLGYVFLQALNPQLVEFKSIQPEGLTSTAGTQPGGTTPGGTTPGGTTPGGTTPGGTTPGGTTPGGTTPGGAVGNGQCSVLSNGVGSVANLQSTCFSSNATAASMIAGIESGGDPTRKSQTDVCKDGSVFSMGLFQVNIIANGSNIGGPCANPRSFFQVNGSGTQGTCLRKSSNNICIQYDCQVTDQNKYNACVSYITDAANNINYSCKISNNGSNWGMWAYSANKCGLR